MTQPFYITTPIYYVNDRPHIGHCYTTLLADVAARAQRLMGRDVFFLTGTDEHAEKVVKAAAERGLTPMAWATQNAERFKEAFAFMGFSNSDFVRTTEDRHKDRASAYIKRLMDSGDIELGDYVGWYDPSQEEYVTETTAKEHDFKSPVTGKPLEQRTEQNYFFRLDKYEGWLKSAIETGEFKILPEARRNEVLGRIGQGLQKVPVSRRIKEGDADWGIVMPGDPQHRVYVWIEALCNYLTVVDDASRRKYWPASVHLMAKDIVWFHAVVWPAMLKALGEKAPEVVYAHAYWIAEGRKMSKSLGNFIEIDTLRAYAERYSLDAVRWFLTTQGPLGATDADFAHTRFIEVYNADLANGIGNATSRVANMVEKYFGGLVPNPSGITHFPGMRFGRVGADGAVYATKREFHLTSTGDFEWPIVASEWGVRAAEPDLAHWSEQMSARGAIFLAGLVDSYISATEPYKLVKREEDAVFEYIFDDEIAKGVPQLHVSNKVALSAILYHCAEALRIVSLLLYPAMPFKMAELWRRWNCDHLTDPNDANSAFKAPLKELAEWGGRYSLKPGQKIEKGEGLFMRADPAEAAPGAGAGA